MTHGRNKPTLAQRIAERRQPVTVALDEPPDRHLNAEARRRGWQFLNVFYCGGKAFPWLKAHGALVSALPDSELVQDLRSKGCNVVRLGHLPHPQDNQTPAVLPDLAAFGRKAAEHFHERLFQNVAYVGRDPWGNMRPMFEGFKQRAGELGMTCHLLRHKSSKAFKNKTPPERYVQRHAEFSEWLGKTPSPLGILASGDYAAAELCFMINQAGKDVPTDVAVLGRGERITICEGASPPISSFDNCRETQIHAACELLDRWLKGEEPPREPVFIQPPPIIERQSTNVLAVPDPVVARALRFIWDHFDLPISVEDIAAEAGVCRSLLQRRFREYLKRSVNEEVQRKRLEYCCTLLETRNLTLDELARRIGLRNGTYLHAIFQRKFGITPREYRLRTQTNAPTANHP